VGDVLMRKYFAIVLKCSGIFCESSCWLVVTCSNIERHMKDLIALWTFFYLWHV